MAKDNISYLSIGSNFGDRKLFIQKAIDYLKNDNLIQILKISNIFETDPLEVLEQDKFLNLIIKINTNYSPFELLTELQSIEEKIGRIRRFNKGPREIDLDILTYNYLKISSEKLTLPHPALFSRPFIKEILESISEEIIMTFQYRELDEANYYSIFSK